MAVCRFVFNKEVSKDVIKEKIAQAVFMTEGLYGRAAVRLDAAYLTSECQVVVDTSTPVGEHIAQIFATVATWEFGDEAFVVERLKGSNTKQECTDDTKTH